MRDMSHFCIAVLESDVKFKCPGLVHHQPRLKGGLLVLDCWRVAVIG